MNRIILGLLVSSVALNHSFSQETTGFVSVELDNKQILAIPDSNRMTQYADSLKLAVGKDIWVGYTYTEYSEGIPEVDTGISMLYSVNNGDFKKLTSDKRGKFYIANTYQNTDSLRIKVQDKNYFNFDTTISLTVPSAYFAIPVIPRLKLEIRGKVFIGSLPAEGVEVTIIHQNDSTKLTTRGCFTDSEDYWNCLYLGMYRHSLAFENPNDTVELLFNKAGFITSKKALRITDFDGQLYETKMIYANELLKFPTHNVSLKYSPPLFNKWQVTFDYTYMPKFKTFRRLGIGLEGAILVTNASSDVINFPGTDKLADSLKSSGVFDTTYNTFLITPHLTLWLTKPEKRKFSLYTGVKFPYTIPPHKIFIHPFIGSRFYLDINKALLLECSYASYDINMVDLTYQANGGHLRSSHTKRINGIMVSIGLQVSF